MQTVAEMFATAVNLVPDKPFIVYEGIEITYREMDKQTNSLGNALLQLGNTKGERVAYLFPSSPIIATCDLAIQKIGAISVPIDVMSMSKELRYIINNTEARCLITDEKGYEVYKQIKDNMPSLKHVIVKSEVPIPGTLSFDELISRFSDSLTPVKCSPDDVCTVLYTSGTTGTAKGTMQTHKSVYCGVVHMSSSHKMRFNRENLLCVLPIFNNFGRTVFMISVIYKCGTLLLIEHWGTEKVLEVATTYEATYFGGAPTMFIYLLEGFDPRRHRFNPSLCFVAGAKCPVDVLKKFKETFNTNVVEGYGSTELSGFVTTNPPAGLAKTGSVGIPIGDVTIKVVDDEGQEFPVGGIGEIVVSSDMMAKGYWGDPETTSRAFKADGWVSGDLGYIDQDGYLFLVDRKNDLIIRGGANVFPQEIEEVFYSHPQVMLAVVVGISDRVEGEVPKAFVVLKEGETVSEQELLQFCGERISAYKVPVGVEFRSDLPTSRVGKVLRRELINEVLADRS